MSKYYNQRLLVGNCLDTLKQLADSSIDSVVTDPPYERWGTYYSVDLDKTHI
jgi:predicted methyltransferase